MNNQLEYKGRKLGLFTEKQGNLIIWCVLIDGIQAQSCRSFSHLETNYRACQLIDAEESK